MIRLDSKDLKTMFSPNEVIEIVKLGIIKYAEGKYKVPERLHINRGASTNLIMPAFGEKYYCTKIISVDPLNRNNNLPIISGLLILNDSQTGQTLATMDAPMITALRTAAIGSIGLELFSIPKFRKLGIIGLGVQGYWQTVFALSTMVIFEINCYSRSKVKFDSFHDGIKAKFPTVIINWCPNAEDVVKESDAIITCTTSKTPVFNAKELDISSKRFVSVGSFAKDMQELPEQVYTQADIMVIDTETAKTEVGDVINTINNKWIPISKIYTLANILSGNISIDLPNNIVFKSVGMAAFDLALAEAIYEQNLSN